MSLRKPVSTKNHAVEFNDMITPVDGRSLPNFCTKPAEDGSYIWDVAMASGIPSARNRDLEDTPYPHNFDVVVNQEVLVHVLQEEDRTAMIAETKRVIKPGGTISVRFARLLHNIVERSSTE
jgi:hypothetical protein